MRERERVDHMMLTVEGSSIMWFLSRFSISRDFMSKRVEGILSSRLSNSNSSVTRDRLCVCACMSGGETMEKLITHVLFKLQ